MSKYDPNSVFDSFKKYGQDPSFSNRKRVYYENYDEEYLGTSIQNARMNNDIKKGKINFGPICCCCDNCC